MAAPEAHEGRDQRTGNRSFVDGLGSDPEDEIIVATVISLARTLGLDVIAEGVETQAQLGLLTRLGCRLGQGYLWSPARSTWPAPPPSSNGTTTRVRTRLGHLVGIGVALGTCTWHAVRPG